MFRIDLPDGPVPHYRGISLALVALAFLLMPYRQANCGDGDTEAGARESASAAELADTIMADAARSAASWSTYEAKLRLESPGDEGPFIQVGFVKFASPDRLRMHMAQTAAGPAMSQTTVSNGKTRWIEISDGQVDLPPVVFKMPAGDAGGGGGLADPVTSPKAMIEQLRQMFDLEVISALRGPQGDSGPSASGGATGKGESIFGEPVHWLAGPYRPGSLAQFASTLPDPADDPDAQAASDPLDSLLESIRIAVSRRTGFIHQIEIFGFPEGRSSSREPEQTPVSPPVLINRATFYDVVIGAQIDAEVFQYTPPEGAIVNDLTAVEDAAH